jgi:serine/threonine protein kinase
MTDNSDRTRLKPGAGEDRTRVKPRPDDAATAGDTRIPPPGTGSRPRTSSDWSHPEQWESRDAQALGPGSVIKQRFVLESVLGRGGMGVVYRALDRRKQEAQDREPYVAIKILGEEFRRHPNALTALQREARKAQTLAHPNVITVHDFDRDGTTVYMTMELLDGEPLNRLIAAHAQHGLPPAKALPIIRGAAEALAYAHKNGIVHSDFKPGNVFLTRRGVKVLDFGIARAVPTQLQPDADRTVFDAATLGALTPPYASPEMLAGEPPAPADDVFALGIVAHELLTGRHPFDKVPADRARRDGLRPAAVPDVPRRQRKALAKALSFERAARQPDARAFLRELEGPSPVKKAAYAAALVLLAGIAAYAFYTGSQRKPDVPFADLPAQAQREFNEDVAQGEQALGFGDVALNDAFDYFSRAYAIHRNDPRAVRGLESVADRFLRSMGGTDPGVQRNVLRKLYCQEYLSTYAPVVEACGRTLGQAQCTFERMGCSSPEAGP